MLGVGDRDQLGGRPQRRVVQVVLDAEVNVEFDQHLVEKGMALFAVHRCFADLATEALDHNVVIFQHVVRIHLAIPFPLLLAAPTARCCSSPRTSTIPLTNLAS